MTIFFVIADQPSEIFDQEDAQSQQPVGGEVSLIHHHVKDVVIPTCHKHPISQIMRIALSVMNSTNPPRKDAHTYTVK